MVLMIAGILGFVVNGVRVAMLAVMVVSNREAFDNWHGGTASYFYSMIGILILGLFYRFLLLQEEEKNQSSEKAQR